MLERALTLAASRAAEIEAIYEAAPIGIVLFDTGFRFVRLNRRMAETNGLPAEAHIGHVIEDILPAPTCRILRGMQSRLLAGEEIADLEVSGPDLASGETRFWQVSYRPLRGSDGAVECFLGTVHDITRLKQAEQQLQRSNETYRGLIENNPFGVYLIDADFRMVRVSRGAERVFANTMPLIGRDFSEIIHDIWATDFADEVVRRFRHTLATGDSYRAATTERRAQADVTESYDWRIDRVTLPDGSFGVVCYFYDLTERQAHEQHIGLLMREIDHRARNLLTVVGAVARHTVATSPQDFLHRFEQRIQALAASQDLLIGSRWTNIPVDRLIAAHLAHLDDLLGARIRLEGPEVRVNPAAAQALGMAVHELATNAAKYGALSNRTGHVELHWSIDAPDFRMSWLEVGGPAVTPPARRGFGSTVIGAMVRAALGGTVKLDFAAAGLCWQVECPADRLIAEATAAASPAETLAELSGGR